MPTVLVKGADEADWRDESSYDYTSALTPREWAWEFLRRNPAFQADVTAASQQASTLSFRTSFDVVAAAGNLSRWGVLFRGVLWAQFGRILVSAMVRSCATGHCRTAVRVVGDSAVRALGIVVPCDRPAGARQRPACSSSQRAAYAPARRLWRGYLAPCLPPYRGHLARDAFEAPPEGARVPQWSKSGSTAP
ncbi:transcriptional regulator domain-containing protein [Mesorhizobium sp. ORM6]